LSKLCDVKGLEPVCAHLQNTLEALKT
jgi:hypothetical protein